MTITKAEQKAIQALEKNGIIDPADLIQAARDASHPCHERFTWDIKQAAMERWHDQARAIIRSVTCQIMDDEDVTTPVVQYVGSTTEDAMFVSLPRARSKADTSAILRTELAMLLGNVSRVYGIALSKQKIFGKHVAERLAVIKQQVAALKGEFDE